MNRLLKAIVIVSLLMGTSLGYLRTMDEDAIDISDYVYPKADDTDAYRIAVFGTNDFHGKIFPVEYLNQVTGKTFESGGVEYLSSYIDILRNEWNERFLWLDAGDQFQGSMEFTILNGTIMNKFYDTKRVKAMGIGNHEFDFGIEELKKKMGESQHDYLSANIYDTVAKSYESFPRQKRSMLYDVDKVKIGVIGLATITTPVNTATDLTNYKFEDYREIVINEAAELRKQGAKAIVLLTHFGPICNTDMETLFKLDIRTKETQQKNCKNDKEFTHLINSLDKGVIDVVIAGHEHEINHHWINGIPVIQTTGSSYSNVLYLAFDPNNEYKIIPEKISIEGPMPSCNKVFEKTRRCEFVPKLEIELAGLMKSFTFHNKPVLRDQELTEVLKEYQDELNKRKEFVVNNEAVLTRNKMGESTLNNIVTDNCRKLTGADLSFYNTGGIRTQWYPGKLTTIDMYNMFPFDNEYVTFKMTGAEMLRMLTDIQNGSEVSPTSGIMQYFKKVSSTEHVLIDVKMFNDYRESNIDYEKDYLICTNDFLANGGGMFAKVLEWYTMREKNIHGVIRTHMTNYLRSIGTIKENMFIDPNHPRSRFAHVY